MSAIVGALTRLLGRRAVVSNAVRGATNFAARAGRVNATRVGNALVRRPRYTFNGLRRPRLYNSGRLPLKSDFNVQLHTGRVAPRFAFNPPDWVKEPQDKILRSPRLRGLNSADGFTRYRVAKNPQFHKNFGVFDYENSGYMRNPPTSMSPVDKPLDPRLTRREKLSMSIRDLRRAGTSLDAGKTGSTNSLFKKVNIKEVPMRKKTFYDRLRGMLDSFKSTDNVERGPAGRRVREFLNNGPFKNMEIPKNVKNIPSNVAGYLRRLYDRLRAWFRNRGGKPYKNYTLRYTKNPEFMVQGDKAGSAIFNSVSTGKAPSLLSLYDSPPLSRAVSWDEIIDDSGPLKYPTVKPRPKGILSRGKHRINKRIANFKFNARKRFGKFRTTIPKSVSVKDVNVNAGSRTSSKTNLSKAPSQTLVKTPLGDSQTLVKTPATSTSKIGPQNINKSVVKSPSVKNLSKVGSVKYLPNDATLPEIANAIAKTPSRASLRASGNKLIGVGRNNISDMLTDNLKNNLWSDNVKNVESKQKISKKSLLKKFKEIKNNIKGGWKEMRNGKKFPVFENPAYVTKSGTSAPTKPLKDFSKAFEVNPFASMTSLKEPSAAPAKIAKNFYGGSTYSLPAKVGDRILPNDLLINRPYRSSANPFGGSDGAFSYRRSMNPFPSTESVSRPRKYRRSLNPFPSTESMSRPAIREANRRSMNPFPSTESLSRPAFRDMFTQTDPRKRKIRLPTPKFDKLSSTYNKIKQGYSDFAKRPLINVPRLPKFRMGKPSMEEMMKGLSPEERANRYISPKERQYLTMNQQLKVYKGLTPKAAVLPKELPEIKPKRWPVVGLTPAERKGLTVDAQLKIMKGKVPKSKYFPNSKPSRLITITPAERFHLTPSQELKVLKGKAQKSQFLPKGELKVDVSKFNPKNKPVVSLTMDQKRKLTAGQQVRVMRGQEPLSKYIKSKSTENLKSLSKPKKEVVGTRSSRLREEAAKIRANDMKTQGFSEVKAKKRRGIRRALSDMLIYGGLTSKKSQ